VPPESIRDLIHRAAESYAALGLIGEEVEDEWSYVVELGEAWGARFDEVGGARGDEPASDAASAAVDRAIDEIGRISDPHRAIDWLSTFPQVVLLAVGERQ
jgi:hypothetical protein